MKTIVFIGTQKAGSSREAIKAAERLGYYTVLLTDKKNYLLNRTEFPDVHLMEFCNLNDKDEIKNIINQLKLHALDICAVVSFVDTHCLTACIIAEELGLNHFSREAIANMLNKIASREILSNSSYAPYFDILTKITQLSKEELEEKLPVVLKSPSSTGSKDVLKVNSYKEYKANMKKLFEKYPKEPVLIEEFLDGQQYLVETVTYNNELHIIAVIHQEITFNERFIITGYSLMLDIPESFYSKLRSAVEFIVKAHGMEYGACHLEMRYVKDNWRLIEVNPRISGGGMNKLIETGLGISIVEETLKILLNQEPNLKPRFRKNTFAQYVTINKSGTLEKITGRNRAYNCPGVRFVYIGPRKGSFLTPPLSMGNRYAYVIANGETEDEAKENAKLAASQIVFSLKDSEEAKEITLYSKSKTKIITYSDNHKE